MTVCENFVQGEPEVVHAPLHCAVILLDKIRSGDEFERGDVHESIGRDTHAKVSTKGIPDTDVVGRKENSDAFVVCLPT